MQDRLQMEYYHLLFQTGAVAQPHSGNPRRVGTVRCQQAEQLGKRLSLARCLVRINSQSGSVSR